MSNEVEYDPFEYAKELAAGAGSRPQRSLGAKGADAAA